MSEADSGDLSPSLVEGEVDFPFSSQKLYFLVASIHLLLWMKQNLR